MPTDPYLVAVGWCVAQDQVLPLSREERIHASLLAVETASGPGRRASPADVRSRYRLAVDPLPTWVRMWRPGGDLRPLGTALTCIGAQDVGVWVRRARGDAAVLTPEHIARADALAELRRLVGPPPDTSSFVDVPGDVDAWAALGGWALAAAAEIAAGVVDAAAITLLPAEVW